MSELTTTFTARPGGIMTTQVGNITGEVEMRSRLDDHGQATTQVRYVGAEEWYDVEGATDHLDDPAELAEHHQRLVEANRGLDAPPSTDPPAGSVAGHDADDPAAGSFGGALGES